MANESFLLKQEVKVTVVRIQDTPHKHDGAIYREQQKVHQEPFSNSGGFPSTSFAPPVGDSIQGQGLRAVH